MANIVAVAPHPDDETLGCGGALLKHAKAGDKIHWVIATSMTASSGHSPADIKARALLIKQVAAAYGFSSVVQLGFATTWLDATPKREIVAGFAKAFKDLKPVTVYLPHRGDPHTDHRAVFEAAASCLKWFRCPSVKRVLSYEALSETGHALGTPAPFRPNSYTGIEAELKRKLEILSLYAGELGKFPFPRSLEAVRALAAVRGSECGLQAAEAFELLVERG